MNNANQLISDCEVDLPVQSHIESKVNYSDYLRVMWSNQSSATKISKKMSVLSFAQILRSYFLFSTVGFAFINEGEQAILYEMSHIYAQLILLFYMY